MAFAQLSACLGAHCAGATALLIRGKERLMFR